MSNWFQIIVFVLVLLVAGFFINKYFFSETTSIYSEEGVGLPENELHVTDTSPEVSDSAIDVSQQTAASPDWSTFSDETSLYTFKFPKSWQTFIRKGEDTSTGFVYVVPSRNESFIEGESGRYRLRTPEDVDEYIEVSGAFLYSFADSLEKFLPGFEKMMNEQKNYVLDTLKGSNYAQQEVTYGDVPAYITTYELNNQKIYTFTALAKGSPSKEVGPVIVGFRYVAVPQYYSSEIAETFRLSFSDTLQNMVKIVTEKEQERINLENKDVKEYTILKDSFIDASAKITSALTDWDGRISSDPENKVTSISQTKIKFTDKTEQAIKLVSDGLGDTVGIFRNYNLPDNADVIEFCFNYQGTENKDNIAFYTSDKPLLNYGVSMEDNEFTDGDTMLFPRDYINTSLSFILVNRSGDHVEATLSRFRAVSTDYLLKNPLNCDT